MCGAPAQGQREVMPVTTKTEEKRNSLVLVNCEVLNVCILRTYTVLLYTVHYNNEPFFGGIGTFNIFLSAQLSSKPNIVSKFCLEREG